MSLKCISTFSTFLDFLDTRSTSVVYKKGLVNKIYEFIGTEKGYDKKIYVSCRLDIIRLTLTYYIMQNLTLA